MQTYANNSKPMHFTAIQTIADCISRYRIRDDHPLTPPPCEEGKR